MEITAGLTPNLGGYQAQITLSLTVRYVFAYI